MLRSTPTIELMRRKSRVPRLPRRTSLALILIFLILLVLPLTPIALTFLGSIGSRDWDTLNDVSGSYNIIGVMLSSIALLAVTMSLLQQREEVRIARSDAIRNRHDEVYGMAIADPELLACLKGSKWSHLSEIEFKQVNYINIVVNGWLFGYRIGHLDEKALRGSVQEVLTSGPGRIFARTMRSEWIFSADEPTLEERFVKIILTEFDRLMEIEKSDTGNSNSAAND